jgi:hypothetical protein
MSLIAMTAAAALSAAGEPPQIGPIDVPSRLSGGLVFSLVDWGFNQWNVMAYDADINVRSRSNPSNGFSFKLRVDCEAHTYGVMADFSDIDLTSVQR